MRKATRYARTSALPAIAAALALSSTPLFTQQALAQEAPAQPTTSPTTPATTDPAPVSAQPAPVLDTATPPVSDTTSATPDAATPVKTAAKPKRVAAAKPTATRTVTQRTMTRTRHAAVPAAAARAAAPAQPAAPVASQSAVKPVIDTSATPASPAPTAAAKTSGGMDNSTAMELGGGALALIALGAGAWALSRRRRRAEDEAIYEDSYEPEAEVAEEPEMVAAVEREPAPMPRHDPIEQPNIVAPAASAFSWGRPDPATQAEDDGSDRRPGETWVERAYRGPSPANPSVSLKNRLRRAAFFDKRERDVEAGKAEPVDTDAGLPDAMVEEQERELA